MGKEEKLLNKMGRSTGMKVPEGYFDDFSRKMMDSLPAYPEAPRPQVLTRWQRIKPYVYMAAMFAGIWCMMKMFHIASQNAQSGVDAVPDAVVLAMQESGNEYYEYVAEDTESDFELQEDLSADYASIEEFEKDFDYNLRPEYANIEIS
ncbi:MAG: hypothetical protein HDS45_01400 [Bacteroides sp.]|nr:hypothetical protein [Bacteroides sp.]